MSDQQDQNPATEGDPTASGDPPEGAPDDETAEVSSVGAKAPPDRGAATEEAGAEPEPGAAPDEDAGASAADEGPAGAADGEASAVGTKAPDAGAARTSYEDRPDAPIPIDPSFRLQLPGFEGPLDLLLFLIRKHELDILDLPIAFICEKYAEYIRVMEQLNLDVASEYLVMAATLAHIKSKELLPRPPEEQDDDDEDEADPRAELIRRLLEYQKYKRAAEQLGAFGVAGRDVFPRGIPAPKAEGPAPLAEISVFKLIDAFQRIVKRREGQISLEVDAERVTIQERMSQITEALQHRERLSFEELFEGYATTYDLVVTFLALLEMAKSRLTRIYQSEPEGPIYLEARILKVDDHGPDDEPSPAVPSSDSGSPDGAAEEGLAQSRGDAEVAEGVSGPPGGAAEEGLAQSRGDAEVAEGVSGSAGGRAEAGLAQSRGDAEVAEGEGESSVVAPESESASGSESDAASESESAWSESASGSESDAASESVLDSAGDTDQDPDGR